MRIAIFHDYLNQYGGAERVLEILCEIFPEAPIYTLFYDKDRMDGKFAERIAVTSFLDFPFARRHHRSFIPLMSLAASAIRLKEKYDLVISTSASYAKGFPVPVGTKHICYCYTPLRYAWDEHIAKRGLEAIGVPGIFSAVMRPIQGHLRAWDFRAAQKPSKIFAISNFISGKIKECYKRDAAVIYPPVDTVKFSYNPQIARGDFFLTAGRLISNKRFDLAIEAFNELRLPLKIAGAGPDEKMFRKLARSPLIEFAGRVSDEELCRLYRSARAFIFPQEEDFGITAAEAAACGTPVVAYGRGGVLEIIKDGVSGVFFHESSPESLSAAVKKVVAKTWDYVAISKSVQKFSIDNFKKGMLRLIQEV